MSLFCAQDHDCVDMNKWKISSLSCDSHHISTVCLFSAGPHHTGWVRQHMGDKVTEKWDWGVTSCWSENIVQWHRVKPSGFGLYQTFSQYFKILDTHDDFPAASRECLKCRKWNSVEAQRGWWMSNTALMPGRSQERRGAHTSHHVQRFLKWQFGNDNLFLHLGMMHL